MERWMERANGIFSFVRNHCKFLERCCSFILRTLLKNRKNMANTLDQNLIVKHLSNGTLGENLCITCLAPLQDKYENIFTKICKDDTEFCIANVLESVCHIKFSETDHYNICADCFLAATAAYQFYSQVEQSNAILNFYTEELLKNLEDIELPDDNANMICISLPELNMTPLNSYIPDDLKNKLTQNKADDIMIIDHDGTPLYYKTLEDGSLVLCNKKKKSLNKDGSARKRICRTPMSYLLCAYCPLKCKFAAKLKSHMKEDHDIDLFVCKVCKSITEHEQEYHSHMKTHTNVYQCDICSAVCRTRNNIIAHLKAHEERDRLKLIPNCHVCEKCGLVLTSKARLNAHYENMHHKKYKCNYCGRMYKGEACFQKHVRRHEMLSMGCKPKLKKEKKCYCSTCDKYFVDDRALLWHERLHNNERPFTCHECDRKFVTLNRRNQHLITAHTAPSRRCPLCPSLFHLVSMVNTHVKKVHLKLDRRRRMRASKHENVSWRTSTVALRDLRVELQPHILELQQAAVTLGYDPSR